MSRESELNMTRMQLRDVVAGVRRRWRMKVALRGLLITGGAAIALFLVSLYGLDRAAMPAGGVLALRIVGVILVLALGARFLVRPLMRRVTDEQVALYLEEHEPSLQNALLAALDTSDPSVSPAFVRRTIERAIETCRSIDDGRRIDRGEINRFATAFSVIAVFGLGLSAFGPPILRSGADAFLHPLRTGAAVRVAVEPGSITIARGADQVVTAQLNGWQPRAGGAGVAQQIEIHMRTAGDSVFLRIPLLATDDPTVYEVQLFDIGAPTEYYIEADGVRSELFRIDVVDLPYVEQIELEYDYPDYTGIANEVMEDAGDIVALRNTVVTVRAKTTMPVTAARILIEGGATIPMTVNEDGRVEGDIRVVAAGTYTIELTAESGAVVSGSSSYLIDVLDDRGPTVRISKPGHDTRPSNIDEVFVEATAEDDFGVAKLELVYSVNGGAEKTVPLMNPTRPLTEASAGHTFYLEELDLEPGDLVSYFARAVDNGGDGGRTSTSDIFFMNIRPFTRDYRQAQQGGAPPGGGGGGGE
ncbi:MAG TPA: DUF4175 family protein, partial [Longimicrobiales bacterium]|nr:DUF4175 family protein [Longimicrobiales bacterium]